MARTRRRRPAVPGGRGAFRPLPQRWPMNPRSALVTCCLLAVGTPTRAATVPPPGAARLEALVEANIAGVHAYQIGLSRKEGKGDPACWPKAAPPDSALGALEVHQAALLAADVAAVKAWAAGQALELRSDQGSAAPSRRAPRHARQPARKRLHGVPRGPGQRPPPRRGPSGGEPLPDGARGRARRRPLAGAVPLLHRPRPARVRRPVRPSRKRRGPSRRGTLARGQELCVPRGLDRSRVADRGAEDLELGREEPAHPRREGRGQGAAAGAGGGRPGSRG